MAVRLLDRYLLRELIVPLGYCLGGFLIFYIAFDLIFQINRFQDAHLLFVDVIEYYGVTLPEILVGQVIPISLLLASLYALTNHGRYNELTAMRAAGVGLWRLALPYLAVGLACGAGVFAIEELWVAHASEKARDIMTRRKEPNADHNWISKLDFNNEGDHRHWIIARFNRATTEMVQPTLTWQSLDGSLHQIFAQRGVYTNGEWQFYNLEKWDKAADEPFAQQTTNAVLSIDLPETPAWIRSEIKISTLNVADAAKGPQLSIPEILDYMRLHPHTQKRSVLLTELQGRIAAPFTCLAVVLIALPFGLRSGRRNVFVGVAGSIFICFGYFVLQRISFSLGVGGYWPPVLAAWLPNVVFGATGVFLMTRVH